MPFVPKQRYLLNPVLRERYKQDPRFFAFIDALDELRETWGYTFEALQEAVTLMHERDQSEEALRGPTT